MILEGIVNDGALKRRFERGLARMERKNKHWFIMDQAEIDEMFRVRKIRRIVEVEKLVLDEGGGWSLGRRLKARQEQELRARKGKAQGDCAQ